MNIMPCKQVISKYDDLKRAQKSIVATESIVLAAIPPTEDVEMVTSSEPNMGDYDSKIMEMMEETKQERDVCYFYLESTNWDIKEAISMYKNMTEG